MDRKKAKKLQATRVVMTNIFMGLSVIAIVFILMLVAMGFSFNENGSLEQSGLLQLSSHPSGATVEVDGETLFSRTEISKMLSAGEHQVKVTKSGYDTWETNIRVDAGLLTHISWIRLFPLNPTIEDVASYNPARLLSFSSDRKSLLYLEQGDTKLQFINLQSDSIKTTKINLATILNTTDQATLESANLSVVAWNNSGNKILLNWSHDSTEWILADLEKPENSINLTQKFNLVFSKILIANDSASKLWAVENGNLHLIDLSTATISPVKATGVEYIANNNDVVAYLRTGITLDEDGNESTVRLLETFREGEAGASEIADLTTENPSSFTLALGTYWSEEWLAYSTDNKLTILTGNYPTYDKNNKNSLKTSLKRELDYSPNQISLTSEQRIVAYANANRVMSFDFETKDYYDIQLGSDTGAYWLDDYIIWQNEGDKITIRDFNGNNYRELITDASDASPLCLAANNKWLFYFAIEESTTDNESATNAATDDSTTTANESSADGTNNSTNADGSADTAAETQTTQYVLKREKLNI